MTAPYLSPRLHLLNDADRLQQIPEGVTAEAQVFVPTLEVRLGAGRPRRYALQEERLTIGGNGCDVVLPESTVPELVAEMVAQHGGREFQLIRIDPAFPILVNGRPLPNGAPIMLRHGDRVAVGAVDLTIQNPTVHLRPEYKASTPASQGYEASWNLPQTYLTHQTASNEEQKYEEIRKALEQEREELVRWREQIQEQAAELEADRQLWYSRRAEMAQESRSAEQLAQREATLLHFQNELEKSRQDLAEQFRQRKEQLSRMQEALDASAAALNLQRKQFEEDSTRRLAEIEAAQQTRSASVVNTAISSEVAESLAREKEQFAEELLRLERRQTLQEDHEKSLRVRELEVERQQDELTRRRLEFEQEQELFTAESARLQSERTLWEEGSSERAALQASLAEREQALEAQQAKLVVLRAALERQQEDQRSEAAMLAKERLQLEQSREQISEKLREAEALRQEFASLHDERASQTKLVKEREQLLEQNLAELNAQRDMLERERRTLQQRAEELDQQTATIAEQTAEVQARAKQFVALQEQHEHEKITLAQRLAALTEADAARQLFQEQLRRRSEEITARAKALDDVTRRLTEEQAKNEQLRKELDLEREQLRAEHTDEELALRALTEELERRTVELQTREANLERQSTRLREVGKLVAEEKRRLTEVREQWLQEQQAKQATEEAARQEFQEFYRQAQQEFEQLRQQAPVLFDQVKEAMARLETSRETIRLKLNEVHSFAGQTRNSLEELRTELHAEVMKLEERERALEQARSAHRLAVAEFRSQVADWQEKLSQFRVASEQEAEYLQTRQAEVTAAAQQADQTTLELARRAEELEAEKQRLAERRTEMELHLNGMREWYRRKLKELAQASVPPSLPNVVSIAAARGPTEEPDPGDKHLGETLKRLELIDAETLELLWGEARRQRRPLRQLLLSEGTVTLYQLAMIETGQLNTLMLGRLRVIDRPRVTPRESIYRVLDPQRSDWSNRGVFLLRHLSEAEMEDAVRPDEFRQQFDTAREAAHPNLAAVVEVMEIQNRPAALLEWVQGLPSAEWPAEAGIPGIWVRLLMDAGKALDAAHRYGLIHGRLSSDSFVLTQNAQLKLLGVGEPWWLATGTSPAGEPSIEADLRALGQVAYTWSRLGRPAGVRRNRVQPFPESLSAVVRRLEADPETPMADTAPGAVPYHSAAELVADLTRLANIIPVPPDAWAELQRKLREHGAPALVRQSA